MQSQHGMYCFFRGLRSPAGRLGAAGRAGWDTTNSAASCRLVLMSLDSSYSPCAEHRRRSVESAREQSAGAARKNAEMFNVFLLFKYLVLNTTSHDSENQPTHVDLDRSLYTSQREKIQLHRAVCRNRNQRRNIARETVGASQ